jgi:hypothetical protein
MEEAFAEQCRLRHREHILAQLSPSLRDDCLVNALASLEAGCDYASALSAFISEQWTLHRASQELAEGRAKAEAEAAKLDTPDETIKSSTSCSDFQ